MRDRTHFRIILMFVLLFLSSSGNTQSYFKASTESDQFFNQKIQRFSNQDILIVDSSLTPLATGGETGEITIIRLDECGNEVWAQSYIFDEGYLEFADFKISEDDEIFVYGSFYTGLRELIFISKFEEESGENISFKLLDPGTVDHLSYSVGVKNGEVWIYGLLFDFNTLKLGFVAVYNENLGFNWAKKFAPFRSTGNSIRTADNGFLGWHGEYIFKLNNQGDLEWGREIDLTSDIFVVNGPFEVSDGYIFESNRSNRSFFFKINRQGDLAWKSDQFHASGYGAALSPLNDGNIICTYSYPVGNYSDLSQMMISSDGSFSNQRSMLFDNTFNSGRIYQTLDQNNRLTLVANSNPLAIGSFDIKDFVVQFSLDSLNDDCWSWEPFEETFPNEIDLNILDHTFELEDLEMTVELNTTLDSSLISLKLRGLCGETINAEQLSRDTLMSCNEDWDVTLPGLDYEWLDDSSLGSARTLIEPGIYKARKKSCTDPTIVQYTLSKSACGCEVFVPNVFSPNFDGVNDQLEFFSDCIIDKVEMNIFDRWGEKVFQSKGSDQLWDGTFKQKDMPIGVYIVVVKYEFIESDGSVQERFLSQDVTVVR